METKITWQMMALCIILTMMTILAIIGTMALLFLYNFASNPDDAINQAVGFINGYYAQQPLIKEKSLEIAEYCSPLWYKYENGVLHPEGIPGLICYDINDDCYEWSDTELLQHCYGYITWEYLRNMTYGTTRFMTPNEIIRYEIGDCLDFSITLCSMLESLAIHCDVEMNGTHAWSVFTPSFSSKKFIADVSGNEFRRIE